MIKPILEAYHNQTKNQDRGQGYRRNGLNNNHKRMNQIIHPLKTIHEDAS